MVAEPVTVVMVLPSVVMVAARSEVVIGVPETVVEPVVVSMVEPSVVMVPTRGRTVRPAPVALAVALAASELTDEVRPARAPELDAFASWVELVMYSVACVSCLICCC